MMINPNARYIEMHLDRLSEELINNTFGKRIDELKEKGIKNTIANKNNSESED